MIRRVLVCGGRHYSFRAFLFKILDGLHAEHQFRDFMQGGASGADRLAKEWAMTHPEIVRWECKANWTDLSHPDAIIRTRARDGVKYDARAGHRRNTRMLEWGPDLVVAFRGRAGTANMVQQSRAAGVNVIQVRDPRVLNKHRDAIDPERSRFCGRGSPFGNPFLIGVHGDRDEVCDRFEAEVLPDLDVSELCGYDLVCYCKPRRCHCDPILVKANT
jgi:Domain of unknown function (DUF4326)/YspA, cpYpsA-related SLOG family